MSKAGKVEVFTIGPWKYLKNHGPTLVSVMNKSTGEIRTLHPGDVMHQTAPLRWWWAEEPVEFDAPLV